MSSNESDVELDELFRKKMVEKASKTLAQAQLRPTKHSNKSKSSRSATKGTDSEREMKNLKSSQEKPKKKVAQHLSPKAKKGEIQKLQSPDPEMLLLSPGTSISKLSNRYRNLQKSGDIPSRERTKRKKSSSTVPQVTEKNRRGSSGNSDLETTPPNMPSLVPGDNKIQASVTRFSDSRSSDSVQDGPIKEKRKTKKLKHKQSEKTSVTHEESPVKTKYTEIKEKPNGSTTSVLGNKIGTLMAKESSSHATSPREPSTSTSLNVELQSDGSSEEDAGISKTFDTELMKKQRAKGPLKAEKPSNGGSKSSPKPPMPAQDTDTFQFRGSDTESSSEEDIGISKTFEAEMLKRQHKHSSSGPQNRENVEAEEGINVAHQRCLWYDDGSSEKTELWLVRAPAGLDLNNMKGKALLLQGVQSLGSSGSGNTSFEVQASKEGSDEMISVQPVISNNKKMVAEICGLLSIVQSVAVPPVLIPATVAPAPKPQPKGLKVRFQPIGSGSPPRNNGSQHSKKMKKRHKRHLSESHTVQQTEVIGDESSVADDSLEALDTRKSRKERGYYTDVDGDHSTKRKKKKHSRDKYGTNYYTDVDDAQPVTKRKRKKHSRSQSDVEDSQGASRREEKKLSQSDSNEDLYEEPLISGRQKTKHSRNQSDYTDMDDDHPVTKRRKRRHSRDQSETLATSYSSVPVNELGEATDAHRKKKKKHKEHSH